ncbi:MAG: aldehyde dehydrogenase family protein [Halobacteriota archaeon]
MVDSGMACDFGPLVARHRSFFRSGKTRPVTWREAQLSALRALVTERADDFHAALRDDFSRSRAYANVGELGHIASEAANAKKQLRSWMRPERIGMPLLLQPGRMEVRFDPLGVGLIIGTWNYPLMLSLSPLVGAIAGGNAAVIKPSDKAPATAATLERLVPEYLDTDAFSVVLGGRAEMTALLEQRWDHIFFTGSSAVGKIVMAAAAKHLTPVTLELGGKNPAIVHSSANLRVAARRIAQGRWQNSGQSCLAPDYVLVLKDVKEEFLRHLKDAVFEFYGAPQQSVDYGRIVNTHHYDRLMALLDSGDVYCSGEHDRENLRMSPVILVNVAPDAAVMEHEIFGPILPVLEVTSIEEAIEYISSRPQPLGLYIFSEDSSIAQHILNATESGGAMVNDCSFQSLMPGLPFGGVGASGIGKYHGIWGFRSYTNARGIVYHSARLDPDMRYTRLMSPTDSWLRVLLEKESKSD